MRRMPYWHRASPRRRRSGRCDSVSEGNKRCGYVVSHDSVVPLERQAAFVNNVERRIIAAVPHARVVMHGHIGDGNIHVVALIDRDRRTDPAATAALVAEINEIVDDETAEQGGAISAEHGIGITNRGRLARDRSVRYRTDARHQAPARSERPDEPDKIFASALRGTGAA